MTGKYRKIIGELLMDTIKGWVSWYTNLDLCSYFCFYKGNKYEFEYETILSNGYVAHYSIVKNDNLVIDFVWDIIEIDDSNAFIQVPKDHKLGLSLLKEVYKKIDKIEEKMWEEILPKLIKDVMKIKLKNIDFYI